MKENRFYVYGNYTVDTNELFYIGEGIKKRINDRCNRNRHWNFKVKKHGFKSEIFYSDYTSKTGVFMMKKLISILLLTITCLGMVPIHANVDISEKMYIDEDEFRTRSELGDAFHIHIGNNVWLCTNTVHRDKTGLFTYECNIARSMKGLGSGYEMSYEKKWKCPYCYNYWPIGTPCQNKDCASKYK